MARMASLRAKWLALGGLALLVGCEDIWINTTFPLGGNNPGGRGAVEVVFVNETPYRAIFTFGTYDPQDQNSVPTFGQFAVDPKQDETAFNRGLAADTVTARGSFFANCGRVFSLGSEGLIAQIRETKATTFNSAPLVEDAMRAGVYFTSKPLDDADANAVQSFDIRMDPHVSLLGVDYSCNALLVYTLAIDPNNAGRVVVNLEVLEAQSE